jgi:hypothetical protein
MTTFLTLLKDARPTENLKAVCSLRAAPYRFKRSLQSLAAYRVVNDVDLTHSLFEFLPCVIDKFVRAQASDEFLILTRRRRDYKCPLTEGLEREIPLTGCSGIG